MVLADVIGYVAAFMTTFSFVPQAVQSYRTRDVSGISLTMYLVFTLGVAFWLVYGVMTGSWPVIIANGVTLVLAGAILSLKIAERNAGRGEAPLANKTDFS